MSDVTVSVLPPVGMITIRGGFDTLRGPVAQVTGLDLPSRRMAVWGEGRGLLWMSPDELMLTCDYDDAPAISDALQSAFGPGFATAAVVSDARQAFDLKGEGAQVILSKLAPVDFAALAPSEVRRTRLAQVPAALWRQDDGWRLVCFRSVAVYVEGLLRNAAA
ncbi:sarcosine oxidase subunit gamma [Jannaschia sp. M317]|uniref:sarcosine oxidase subunit gamma n=1 Tax=Jannaschia sp. M317 TaxID=2867011 RepID=UPI0021A827B8|nr:sarcosine oxidase subunit gamma family protein [Jannaschia sp. M317]UWQ16760.1 sarcosine oxidase subunit gamma [Jannaschia sp. M317]